MKAVSTAGSHEDACRIGCLLVKGEWEAAVNFIMRQRSGEKDPLPEARRLFNEDKNLSASNKLMPHYASAEKAILQVDIFTAFLNLTVLHQSTRTRIKQEQTSIPPWQKFKSACLLQGLLYQGHTNYVAALQQIPRNLRTMYLHSVQSLLWNLAASHRAGTLGIAQVSVGDLVLPPDADASFQGLLQQQFSGDLPVHSTLQLLCCKG